MTTPEIKNSNQGAHLKHKLKNRHLQMIAIGGVIGTGLFFGSAKSIHLTGPSIILSYMLGGLIMYIIMRALGEMTIYSPSSGSFSEYAHQYLGNYAGFIAGWNAWFEYTVVCMVELTAVTLFFDYWVQGIPHWLICLIILTIFTAINLSSIRFFGEFEFWFAAIKVAAIVLMLLFSAYLIIFHHHLNPDILSYKNPSLFFAGGGFGFLVSLVIVIFSFGGTEFVSIAAAEAENPARNVPRAINGVILRILIFYVFTMVAIIALYPYAKLSQNISPFVDVFTKIGIPVAAKTMNIVAISAALSAFNSCLYSSSRMLYNLAEHRNAPQQLAKLNPRGIPAKSVLFTSLAIFSTVIINYLYPERAIIYLLSIATCAILITWIIILLSQLSFRRQHSHNLDEIKYRLQLFPYSNIFAIIILALVMVIMSRMDDMKLSVWITPFWILALTILFFMRKKYLVGQANHKDTTNEK
jgi:amino acid transporter, AAT family